jgi:hypothetical protein
MPENTLNYILNAYPGDPYSLRSTRFACPRPDINLLHRLRCLAVSDVSLSRRKTQFIMSIQLLVGLPRAL